MGSTIAVREQANGVAYTLGRTTILFRWGVDPALLFGDDLVKITDPARFGEWESAKHRRAYIRRFVAGLADFAREQEGK